MRNYAEAVSLKDTLKSIELNLSNNCNRACSFCPHSLDTYEFKHGIMSLDTVKIITQRLIDYDYSNRVSVCGFGEPLVNKNLPNILTCLRSTKGFLELTTNGDLLTEDNITVMFDNGLDLLNVSIYDIDSDQRITSLLSTVLSPDKFIIRRRYTDTSNLVNRVDIVNKVGSTKNKSCYVPSYKMMVDYDGTVLLCSNDWTRKLNFGNLCTTDLETIWINNMHDKRVKLIQGDRQTDMCQICDIDGTKMGSSVADFYKQHYSIK